MHSFFVQMPKCPNLTAMICSTDSCVGLVGTPPKQKAVMFKHDTVVKPALQSSSPVGKSLWSGELT